MQRSTSTGKDADVTAPRDTNENHTSYCLTPIGEAYHQNMEAKGWWGRGAVKDPPHADVNAPCVSQQLLFYPADGRSAPYTLHSSACISLHKPGLSSLILQHLQILTL